MKLQRISLTLLKVTTHTLLWGQSTERSLDSSASSIQAGQAASLSLPEGSFPQGKAPSVAPSCYIAGAEVQSTWSIPSVYAERENECLATLRITEMVISFLNCLPIDIKSVLLGKGVWRGISTGLTKPIMWAFSTDLRAYLALIIFSFFKMSNH